MNVLIIGSGGREHALAYKISESPRLDELYISPGNPGTESLGKNVVIDFLNKNEVSEFCNKNNIELVVVGPEQPLVDGIADMLRNQNINVFGPSKSAARIEGDKSFAKELMKKYSIPTAKFSIFKKSEELEVLTYLETALYPLVIKASGLAAGKGVVICETKDDAAITIRLMFKSRLFGDATAKIVVEEYLTGPEISVFVITDGNDFVMLPPSQDHKRAFDNDQGKNTGGMGAYAPVPFASDRVMNEIKNSIVIPTLDAMKKENCEFNGCLYCGLMLTEDGPKVIEYNCRFGDPETQVVLPILEGDFLELLYSVSIGKVNKNAVNVSNSCAICVVLASGGYPDIYTKGKIITGLDSVDLTNTIVFHAGTKVENERLKSNGGRVLGVTSINRPSDLKLCKITVYSELSKIKFEDMHFRKDISDKAFQEIY